MLHRFRTHPRNAILLAYHDGELPQSSLEQVRFHLTNCRHCRKELELIGRDLLHFDRLTGKIDAGFVLEAGLSNLEKSMQVKIREAQHSASASGLLISQVLLASIQAELAIYLGAQSAQKVLDRAKTMSLGPGDLGKLIEPLMAGLLGEHGAAAVVGRVALLCESPGVSLPPSVMQ